VKLNRRDLRRLIESVINEGPADDAFDALDDEMSNYEKNKKSTPNTPASQQSKPGSEKEKQKDQQGAEPDESAAVKQFTGKLTAQQSNNPNVVGKFIAQYELEIKGANPFDEMDISMKYGLVQQNNDVYVFELADGNRVMFTKSGQKKKEIKESLSRGSLYRRRYHGRY